ncbi:MFS general substrate transporter [Cytidiella melzeri]|nr:MFS general substrate transporter [Cytidiella melzeri]
MSLRAAVGGARRFVWGEVPQTKQERKLLLKIDWFILSYCCLMYFTNYLDRSNVANAYVSGMQEELRMVGNQYNKINTIFTCGYIVGMIPNNLMLQVVSPRVWLPTMQIVWGVLTMCTSAVGNVQQIYAIRFFQGITESSTFVGTHYILGAWYKTGELGKRSGIFTSSGLAGTLFSGVLQAAVYQHLNGHAGRSGWRWLFIIDGIITLPIALYGFLIFPDVPTTTKAFYLTKEERLLSYERLEERDSRKDVSHSRPTLNLFKRVLSRWRWYGCSLLFLISGETESFGSNNLMGQWLKTLTASPSSPHHYTVEQIDYLPLGATAFGIVSTLVCSTWTDATASRARWPVLVYMSLAVIVSSIILLATKDRSGLTGLQFVAWYLAGASYAGQATTFAWANQICADDDQERGIVLASMNMWNNVINAWWPLVFYPATDSPWFTKGMWAMIGTALATLGVTALVWWLERREKRRVTGKEGFKQGGGENEGGKTEVEMQKTDSREEGERHSYEKEKEA